MRYALFGAAILCLSKSVGSDLAEGAVDPGEPRVRAPSTADELKAAMVAFENGTSYFKGKEYSKAAEAFRRANMLKPNWKLLFNIGQSEAASWSCPGSV